MLMNVFDIVCFVFLLFVLSVMVSVLLFLYSVVKWLLLVGYVSMYVVVLIFDSIFFDMVLIMVIEVVGVMFVMYNCLLLVLNVVLYGDGMC